MAFIGAGSLDHGAGPCYPLPPMNANTRRLAGAALLVVASAWGWVEAARAGRTAADPAEAEALASALSEALKPGEVAVVRPTLLGLGTALDSLPVMPAPPPPRGDLEGRYSTAAPADLSSPPSEDAWLPDVAPGDERDLDGAAILPLAVGGAWSPGVRLLDLMATATVELVPADGGAPQRCDPWSGSRLRCGDDGWMQVGRAVTRVGGSTVSCIWAHPQEGRAVRLTFPAVTLGRALRGTVALIDGTGAGADVQVAVSIDGEELGTVRVPGRGPTSVPINLPTPERSGTTGAVTLQVSAPSSRWRQVCLDPVVDAGEVRR